MELDRSFDSGNEGGVLDLRDLSVNPEIRIVLSLELQLEIVVGEGLSEMVLTGIPTRSPQRGLVDAGERDGLDCLSDEAAHEV